MPQRVYLDGRRVRVGEEARPLLNGEVHYWRLAPADWPRVLDAVRALGLDIVSTYIPWEFHELAPGEFDFDGRTDPRRDLVSFLELSAAEGMWVLLRPGPYVYAEWRNSGVPDRVVPYHRSHPEFRREAEQWMAAVVETFAPFLATRGGPVVLVQADNEPDPWTDVYGVQLPSAARAVDVLEVARFSHQYTAEIVKWTADTYRALGVDVPIYSNAYQGFGVQNWRSMQASVDFVGPDVYPTAELRGDPSEHRRLLERLRFTRTFSPLPYIPEFEAGIWHGWHERIGILRPNHYRLICLSALLAGVAGWGWYMLVNRDNWYMSPIDELGRARPDLADEFSAIVRVFHALDPPSLEKLTDTAVAMDVLQLGAHVGGPPGEAVLDALYRADIDYEFFDLDTGEIAKPLLFYAGADQLTDEARATLQAYVQDGGTLVIFQQPATLGLRPFEGVLRDDQPRPLTLRLGAHEVQCFSNVFGWYSSDVPGEPIVAERGTLPDTGQQGGDLHGRLPLGERFVVGSREPRGQGSIVNLGIVPSAEVVVGLHRWLDVPIASRAVTGHVSTALFRATDGTRYLIAANNGEQDTIAGIELAEPCSQATDLFSGASWSVHGDLSVPFAAKSGTALRLHG